MTTRPLLERVRATGRVLDPFRTARGEAELQAEVVVVGTGAGGSAVFRELALAGVDVLALEAGHFHLPHVEFDQRELTMLSRLYWSQGARVDETLSVTVTHGKGVGGSTVHNICLIESLPPAIRARWRAEYDLGEPWSDPRLAAAEARVRRMLHVAPIAEGEVNRNNAVARAGAQALGWRHRIYEHNRVGCLQCGYCELGCAYNRKQSALITYVPAGILAGGRLLYGAHVERIDRRAKAVVGVSGTLVDPLDGDRPLGRFRVRARHVVLAASAMHTPTLLLASEIYDPGGWTGARLRLHPAVPVAARFRDPILGWQGLPQSVIVDEFAHFYRDGYGGFLIIPLFGHPGAATAMLPGWGSELARWLRAYPYTAAASPLLHDESRGRIYLRGGELRFRYALDERDRATMRAAIKATARLFLAAGADEVLLPYRRRVVTIRRESELTIVDELGTDADALLLSSVHPQGSVPMAADPARGAVDPRGRHWLHPNLWVADASLFPTSIGVPPQLTIYTLATLVARELLRDLRGR